MVASVRLEPPKALDKEDVTFLLSTPLSGVFFLCKDDKIVHIGASTDVLTSVQRMRPKLSWDRVYYKPVPPEGLSATRQYMRFKYNTGKVQANEDTDAE